MVLKLENGCFTDCHHEGRQTMSVGQIWCATGTGFCISWAQENA